MRPGKMPATQPMQAKMPAILEAGGGFASYGRGEDRRDPQGSTRVCSSKGMQDFYVKYELNAFTNDPSKMFRTYSALHQNIQDAFNEYGVQIMSPNYEADPEGPKVVPKEKWFEAPAKKNV